MMRDGNGVDERLGAVSAIPNGAKMNYYTTIIYTIYTQCIYVLVHRWQNV